MWSYEIGKMMGIPIKVHMTFLLVLPLFIWVFSTGSVRMFGEIVGFGDFPFPQNYVWGTIATLLLFISVLLHELGHSIIARRYGSNIHAIVLFIFGGVSQIENISKKPSEEAKIAVMGPVVSFAIGAICLGAYFGLTVFYEGGLTRLLWILGYINVVLGIFNLLPAFPMDGGRILRAHFARHHTYVIATQKAAFVGKMFAFLMGIAGFFVSIWLILIAFFVYIGASEEEATTRTSSILEGVKLREVMSPHVVYANADITLNELVELMFHARYAGYPVLDEVPVEEGEVKTSMVVGIVTFRDLQKVPPQQRGSVRVREVMSREVTFMDADTNASDAVTKIHQIESGRLLVTQDDTVVGIVSRTDIMRAIQLLSFRYGGRS